MLLSRESEAKDFSFHFQCFYKINYNYNLSLKIGAFIFFFFSFFSHYRKLYIINFVYLICIPIINRKNDCGVLLF